MPLLHWALAHLYIAIFASFGLSVGFVLYCSYIKDRMERAAIALGTKLQYATGTVWTKIIIVTAHWKTIILSGFGGLWAVLSVLSSSGDLVTYAGLPWGTIFNPKTGAYVTIGISLLIGMTHASGLCNAAEKSPVDPADVIPGA